MIKLLHLAPVFVTTSPTACVLPVYLSVGRRNEYQPNGDDALWLGSKGRYGSCVGGRQNCMIPEPSWAISERFRDVFIIRRLTDSLG